MKRVNLNSVLTCLVLFCASLMRADSNDTQAAIKNTAEIVKMLTQIENDWTAASDKGDAKRLAEIIAPDWINVRAYNGGIETRDENIKRSVEDSKSITAPTTFEITNVRVMADVAVVTGSFTVHTSLSGKMVSQKTRFQDVFNKRNGVWVAVNSANTDCK